MEIAILQKIEEFTLMTGNKYGIYLVEINGAKRLISRNCNSFYSFVHESDKDNVWRVTKNVTDEMLRLLGE
jgi:hypothetical protein